MNWEEIDGKFIAYKDPTLYFISDIYPYWFIWVDENDGKLERIDQHFLTREASQPVRHSAPFPHSSACNCASMRLLKFNSSK